MGPAQSEAARAPDRVGDARIGRLLTGLSQAGLHQGGPIRGCLLKSLLKIGAPGIALGFLREKCDQRPIRPLDHGLADDGAAGGGGEQGVRKVRLPWTGGIAG